MDYSKKLVNSTIKLIFLFLLIVASPRSLRAHSAQENSPYPQFCLQAVNNPDIFNTMKGDPVFNSIFNVSPLMGEKYLDFICKYHPQLIPYFDQCRKNDEQGTPPLVNFGAHGYFSPQTLCYMKIAGDLKEYMGNLDNLHIVEIGGGYGGLCKILASVGGFASYTIVGLPECNELTKKYLENNQIQNIRFINIQDLDETVFSDLVISHYFFSEMDVNDQLKCMNYLMKPAHHGYLSLNFKNLAHSLPLNKIISQLYQNGKKGGVTEEFPTEQRGNLTLKWRKIEHLSLNHRPAHSLLPGGNAVTYSFSGGRLGDNLIAYLQAKWISYKYHLPLLFIPFDYSDQFRCHRKENHLTKYKRYFEKESTINFACQLNPENNYKKTILTVPYHPESFREYNMLNYENVSPYFFIDWDDPIFKKVLRKRLKLINPTNTFPLPTDKITVAIHMRRGGGVDGFDMHQKFPLKFPEDSYYIEQVKTVHSIFNQAPLYVHIFTDDLNPLQLLNHYQNVFSHTNIEFSIRTQDNSPHKNVLDDFHMLTKFDCLIRPDSNFSIVASKLHDYLLTIGPSNYYREGDKTVIDQVNITFDPTAARF